jgi:peptide/nickel transport system substrate-binding protein
MSISAGPNIVKEPRIPALRDRLARPLVAGLVAVLVLAAAWSWPRVGLGQGQGQAAAGPADLLKVAPFDRITLIDGTVLNVEPITPRPLPPFDEKKERARQKKLEEKTRPPRAGNIVLPGEQPKARAATAKDEEEQITQINIHALEGEVRDFQVKRTNIKSIEYFEDMLMAESDRLVRRRDYPRGFEFLLAVQARNPHWPGLDDHVNRLLFEEGSAAFIDGENDRGMRLLGEVHARKPDYPGLADKLASAFGARVNRAFELGAYVRGRQILHELEGITPNHTVVNQARSRFVSKAQALVDEAAKSSGGVQTDLLTDALRIWPGLQGAGERFVQAFTALPTLDVAVTDLPNPVAPWVRTPAAARISRLVYLPILAAETEAAMRGTLPGQLAAGLEKAELGRRLELKIRPGIPWSDGSRPVAAIDLVCALADRADPRSPAFNARWADLLETIVAVDEDRVEVRLARTFLKPEAWLLAPVGPAHAAWDGWVTTEKGRQPVGNGPFQWEGATDTMARYAVSPSVSSEGGPKIKRIREVRYASPTLALAAFVRGDVTLLDHVPPNHVPALSKNPEYRIGRYEQPSLHRIAIDGRNPILRNRTLRRGLSYAIDRKTLLEENVLKRPSDDVNTLADGPFPIGSYANAPGVKPFGYDPLLAKMLVAAARKELGGIPIKLSFEYPSTPVAQAVVPKIAEAWRKLGERSDGSSDIEIELIERSESELEDGLRSGRRFDLAYRTNPCLEPVWEGGPTICPGYDAPPSTGALASIASPRILELLLRLERAPEMPTAIGLVITIDRECRDELPILPLWQLEDHFAWRTRLKGPSESAGYLYQGLDSWEIEPWFAKDPW